MTAGIGTDIIEISRVEKACRSEAFLKRVYTAREIEQFQQFPASLAGNFSVKEAVSKALGTGFRGFGPGDVEVLRDELGAPAVTLSGGAAKRAEELGVTRIFASLSHDKERAVAMVVLESEGNTAGKHTEQRKNEGETDNG